MTDKTKQYLERATVIHKGKYDYSLVKEITTNKQYIDIKCPIHGVFSQAVSCHVNAKQGCPRCGGNYRKTTEEVIGEIRAVHGETYQYVPFEYKSNKQKIVIICSRHGQFNQGVKEHLNGGGCPRCAKNAKLDTSGFVEKAIKKHNNRYCYDKVTYVNNSTPITIICHKHGEFLQTPHAHLNGYGCSRCVANSSKKENEWLDSLGIPGLLRQHRLKLGKKIRIVDGFDPKTNTVYEFYGDYFHGNSEYYDHVWTHRLSKKTFGQLYQDTLDKERLIHEHGYKLVCIWESDFCKQNKLRFHRKPLLDTDRFMNRLCFMKQWEMADEDGFNEANFMKFVEESRKTV